MKIALTGDVMLGRLVDKHVISDPGRDPAYVWGDSLPLLAGADARLINLECVIAAAGEPWRPFEKTFHFRAGPSAIDALSAAGIDAVSLANNHVLDFDSGALTECLGLLDGAGIVYAGAGSDRTGAVRPAFLRCGEKSIGLLSLTDNEPEWAAGAARPGIFFIGYDSGGLVEPYLAEVETVIRAARAACDVLIVAAHVGPNWGEPSPAMRALARQLIAFGADCYWGHSNHTPQGIEIFQDRPILYSTGDFIDDYAIDPKERNDLTFLFLLDWQFPNWSLALVPMKINNLQVNRVFGEEANFLADRMTRQSVRFGSALRREGGVLVSSA